MEFDPRDKPQPWTPHPIYSQVNEPLSRKKRFKQQSHTIFKRVPKELWDEILSFAVDDEVDTLYWEVAESFLFKKPAFLLRIFFTWRWVWIWRVGEGATTETQVWDDIRAGLIRHGAVWSPYGY